MSTLRSSHEHKVLITFLPSKDTARVYKASSLVSGCFKSSQPQWIISGLKEIFIKRYIAEKTNKAEVRLKEQSDKAESCREDLWKEIQLKGP